MGHQHLTNRQAEILSFIENYFSEYDCSPSLSTIMEHFQLSSKSTIFQHIEALAKKGYLKKDWNGEVIPKNSSNDVKGHSRLVSIPLYGAIPASPPSEIYPGDEQIEVPDYFLGKGEHFALRVKGDSMVEADIDDGDLVFIRRQATAKSGQVVAARVNQSEVTLKEYRKSRGQIVLHPHNSSMDPIYIESEEFEIQGIMVGLFRKCS